MTSAGRRILSSLGFVPATEFYAQARRAACAEDELRRARLLERYLRASLDMALEREQAKLQEPYVDRHLPALMIDERLDVFLDRCVAEGMNLSDALCWLGNAERAGLVNLYWVGETLWICRTVKPLRPDGPFGDRRQAAQRERVDLAERLYKTYRLVDAEAPPWPALSGPALQGWLRVAAEVLSGRATA